METVQHVSPGMPTQAQLSYAPRSSLPYNTTDQTTEPTYFVRNSAAALAAHYGPLFYHRRNSSNNATSNNATSNSATSHNDNSQTPPIIDRNERSNNANPSTLADYMPPKSRAVLNSTEHRNAHPVRINSNESYSEGTLNAAYHVDHGAPPSKRIKYNDVVFKPEIQQPLRVDTTERTVYNPPVEAISPTLPPAPPPPPPAPPPPRVSSANASQNSNSSLLPTMELSDKQDEAVINIDSNNFSNNPNELMELLGKVEEELRRADQQIHALKKKQKEMEESGNFTTLENTEPVANEIVLPKIIQLAKRIYEENWVKASTSHRFFVKFVTKGQLNDLPEYNQAPDTELYHENKKKYAVLKSYLIDKIRKEKMIKEARDHNIATTYNDLSAEWKRRVEKVENSQKRKARDLKNREVFEKVFPELRKQREDKERFSRSGGRVRSEADLEEIMDGLQEQELEDKKMRSYAVIPPLMLDSKQRRYSFVNNNGLVTDLPKFAKEDENFNIWTEAEKEIFKEKFLQHPKNFSIISSQLERKTACECVAYYYMSKKTEQYKKLLKKTRRTRTKNLQGKANGANAGLANSGDLLYNSTPGVTTRLQREQIQQQQRAEQPRKLLTSASSNVVVVQAPPTSSSLSMTSTVATAATETTSTTDSGAVEEPSSTSNAPASDSSSSAALGDRTGSSSLLPGAATTTIDNDTNTSNAKITNVPGDVSMAEEDGESSAVVPGDACANRPNDSPISPAGQENNAENSAQNTETKPPDMKKKDRRKEDKKKSDSSSHIGDTSEDDLLSAEGNEKGATLHPCFVCKAESSSSRALPKSDAAQYGLKEEDVTAGARVCNRCRCKAVRSRSTPCPLPTCPNTRGSRVKRLRSLPCKWPELPAHIKQPIIAEFHIPNTATKCCSACFNRIQRRLSAMGVVSNVGEDTNTSPTSVSQLFKWTDEETEALKRGITEHGTKWSEIAQLVGPTKTAYQCRTYFFFNRKKLGLDVALQEFNKKHFGDERKPTLSTDEEESGSTTSSCDELDRSVLDDSDTASAPSPAANNNATGSAVIRKTPGGMCTTGGAIINVSCSNMSGTSPRKSTPPVISSIIVKEDYDSSATETADEGVGVGAEIDSGSSSIPITVSIASEQQSTKSNNSVVNNSSTERETTLGLLMNGVITAQLSKPASQPSSTQISNVISSIVDQNLQDSDHRHQITRDNSLAALSVFNSATQQHRPTSHGIIEKNAQYLVTPQSSEVVKESESGTLDLRINKKPKSPEYLGNHTMHGGSQSLLHGPSAKNGSHPSMVSAPIPPLQSPHLYKHPGAPPHEPPNSTFYAPHMVEVAKITNSGEPPYWKMSHLASQPPLIMQQHHLMPLKQTPSVLTKKITSSHQLNQNIKVSPKQSPNNVASGGGMPIVSLNNQPPKISGSIMQGTPVSNTNLYLPNVRDSRYDTGMLGQITPPSHPGTPLVKESAGSITQGTPVHQRGSSHSNSSAEYYPQPTNNKRSGSVSSPSGFYPGRSHSYTDEHRSQIILNDYVTSQRLRTMNDALQRDPVQREKNNSYLYPPPPARQGVIQRHNTNSNTSKPASPHPYPPGHEALKTFADVAVKQPSLPVPLSHSSSPSGLALHKDDKRIIIQEGLGDRIARDPYAQDRYSSRDHRNSEKYARDGPSIHRTSVSMQLEREHQQQQLQQLREQQLLQQQQERDLHHFREQQQQQMQQKIREHERIFETTASAHLAASMRENHHQPPPPSSSLGPQPSSHSHQPSSRELDMSAHVPFSKSAAGQSSVRLTASADAHLRAQSQLPTSLYPMAHEPPFDGGRDAFQSSVPTSTINYNRQSPASLTKSESSRDSGRHENSRSLTSGGRSTADSSSTLTAASLIDAIITHQINQPTETGASATTAQTNPSSHVPTNKLGEKLFQVFPEPDGKLSPMKCAQAIQSRCSPDVKSSQTQPSSSQSVSQSSHPPPVQSHPLSTTSPVDLGPESNRRTPQPPPLSASHVYGEPPAFKLRRALQHKDAQQQAAAAAAAVVEANRNIVRIATVSGSNPVQRPVSPRDKPGLQNWPFDYVKNKIVEEMHRTSDDDGAKSSMSKSTASGGSTEDGNGSGEATATQPPYLPATNYAYPFSTLNINPQVPVSAHSTPTITPKPVDVLEPTPILNSQYEPVSDED